MLCLVGSKLVGRSIDMPTWVQGESNVKRLKGRTLYAVLWLTGILSLVLVSGAPNRLG